MRTIWRSTQMVDITVDGVVRIDVSAVEEYEPDEDDDDEEDEPFSRTLTIELASGEEVTIDLYAASREALDLLDEEE
jgi:hypothetical protein